MEPEEVVMFRDAAGTVWPTPEQARIASDTHILLTVFLERYYPEMKIEALRTIRVHEAMTAIAQNPKLMLEVLETYQKLSGR